MTDKPAHKIRCVCQQFYIQIEEQSCSNRILWIRDLEGGVVVALLMTLDISYNKSHIFNMI